LPCQWCGEQQGRSYVEQENESHCGEHIRCN
jgi:hypothetical protein